MKNETQIAFPEHDDPHIVRFYADEAALLAKAAAFVATALSARGVGIVIAIPAHCASIRDMLGDASGVHFLDAEETLARLLVDGWPDEPRFRAVFQPLLAAVAGAGPVHVVVEMAALLCSRGRYQAALRLEQLLNCLCTDYRIVLFCVYPWRLFPDSAQAQVFEDICAEHGHACGSTVLGVDLDLKGRSLEQARREQKEITPGSAVPEHQQERGPDDAIEGLHRVGPDGTILWADRAELQMLGYHWEEYVGRHIANFHVDVEIVDLILDTLLSGGVLVDQPARLRCKDGAIRHVRMRSTSYFKDGRLFYSVCITRDDAERNERATALTQRDRQLLNAPVAVALFMAPDLRFRLANGHFCNLFGQRRLIGKRLVEAFPQLRYGAVEAALEHVFETGRPWSGEKLGLVLPDAGGMPVERFFNIDLEALYKDGGERHGVMAVVVDVTGHVRTHRVGKTGSAGADGCRTDQALPAGPGVSRPNRRGFKRAVYNTRFRTNRRST